MEQLGSQSYVQLKGHVTFCIDNGDLSGALDILRNFVELVVNEPSATARVLASAELDELYGWVAAEYRRNSPQAPSGRESSGTVILMTDASGHGGHIELAKDLVATGALDHPTILMTDTLKRAQETDLVIPGVETRILRAGNSDERLRALDDTLQELQPRQVLVIVHHQDSTALVALRAQARTDHIYFVHHADHNLCLGATDRGFRHVDLHPMGFHDCRELHGQSNIYWPLSMREVALDARARGFLREQSLVTATAGREAKFEATGYRYDYYALLPVMLNASRGRHVHFGPLSESALARIASELEKAGIEEARFRHVPWVPSLAAALVQENVDIYLPSFPVGGGKSVIEAMAVGIPLFMHENYQYRLLSGVDLGYPGAYVWRDEQDLQRIGTVTRENLERHSVLARKQFEEHHHPRILAEAVAAAPRNWVEAPPLRPYRGNPLQAFLDEQEREHSHYAGQARILEAAQHDVAELNRVSASLRQNLETLQQAHREVSTELLRLQGESSSVFGSLRHVLRAVGRASRQGGSK